MEAFLAQNVGLQAYVFLLVFARIGTALMILPGIGDSFVPARTRLGFCLAFAVILAPLVAPTIPKTAVGTGDFIALLSFEILVGLFIGTIARTLMTALDTAGMLISVHTGLSAVQIFNPAFATQGSVFGGLFSVTGVVLLLVTNMHHMLFAGMLQSYTAFPPGQTGLSFQDMSTAVAESMSQAFAIGFQISVPFMLVMMMVTVCMGVLARLMPQLQIFMLTVPVQILGGLALLSITFGAGLMFWLRGFEASLHTLLGG